MLKTVVFNGIEMPIKDAIAASGASVQEKVVRMRLSRGWPLARALSLPIANKGIHNGSIRKLSRDWG